MWNTYIPLLTTTTYVLDFRIHTTLDYTYILSGDEIHIYISEIHTYISLYQRIFLVKQNIRVKSASAVVASKNL